MHISSMTGSTTKVIAAKSASKSRGRKAASEPQTLHLKAKSLVATHADDLVSRIATAAYYRAEQRGFEPGHELEDWLHAEQQVRLQYS